MGNIVSLETVMGSYSRAEQHRSRRGFYSDMCLPASTTKIPIWQYRVLTPDLYGNLQFWIDKESSLPTHSIYDIIGQPTIKAIVENKDILLSNSKTDYWFSTINPSLKSLIEQNKREPVMLVWPPRFTEGSILDGNHSLVAAYENNLPIHAYIGYYSLTRWFANLLLNYRDSRRTNPNSQKILDRLLKHRLETVE